MPSEKIRKIRQSIQDEIHRGQIITCVNWSPDGKRLYTADISGQIIAIDVDFDNELYSCIYVSDKSIPIRDLKCSNEFLIFCTSNEWNLIEAKNIKLIKSENIEDQDLQLIASTIINENEPAIVYSNGKIQFLNSEEKSYNFFDENFVNNQMFDGKGYFDGIFRDFQEQKSSFTLDDFKVAHFYQRNSNQAIFWSTDKLLIIEFPTLLSKCFNLTELTKNDLFEIITVAIDPISFEIFILSRDHKILRLAGDKAALELISAKEPKPQNSAISGSGTYSFVNSFMSAAQNSSTLFSRLSSIKEFEKLKELRTNPTITDLSNRFNEAMTQVATKSVQSAESGTRLANELFDQIKNSQITSDFDATSKAPKITTIEEEKNENTEMKDSEPLIPSESENEKELIVTRRKKTKINPKRDDLYGISQSELVKKKTTEDYLKDAEIKMGVNEVAVSDVEDHTVEAIIRGDFTIHPTVANVINDSNGILDKTEKEEEGKLETHEIQNEINEISEIAAENVFDGNFNDFPEVYSEIYDSNDDEIEKNISNENEIQLKDEDEEEEDESLEAAAARSQKLAEKEIEKEQDEIEYDTVEDIFLTSNISLPKELQSPDYSQISNLANLRTDIWNTFTLPFTVSDFDVSSNYIVIIPRKQILYYPHYRILDAIQNGLRGGGWTALKYPASQIAVNDQGNLLWRLHKSKVYAPDEIDETSPMAHKWHIQAEHEKIIEISLTTKHAWYLTSNDIFVQMYLPEMGILHQTDCVFRVHSLTASDHAVWALRSDKNTLITRTGIDPQICPMGVDFVEDTLGGPTTFVSIALYDKTGFGIDPNGYLWFVNGVDEKNPLGCGCWFQTCYPTVLDSTQIKKRSINQWQLKVSSLGVFFCIGKHLIAAINDIPLTGHVIKHVIPERLNLHDNFSYISASSSNNGIIPLILFYF
uniref:Anaphase-promoting complex subunit 4 WD40 domain-containing protein n=1 Tax=Panagrolaimus davidi TaxID=227884 RepID=A0A914PTN2_9BILA